MQTRYETVTDSETNETRQVAVNQSRATADLIAHWRAVLAGAMKLDALEQTMLAAAGWPQTRVTVASVLVEAYASADTSQQGAIQDAQSASEEFRTAIYGLEAWYVKGRRLSRIAIRDVDPNNSQNLIELLGVN